MRLRSVGIPFLAFIYGFVFFALSEPIAFSSPTYLVDRAPAAYKKISVDVLSGLNDEVLRPADPAPGVYAKEPSWTAPFDRRHALNDPDNRISEDFKIPKILKKRVGFWFDVYTKYGEHHHVVHHGRYPWIVFEVIDTTDIANHKTWHKWTKYHKAKAAVAARKKAIRNSLVRLSKRRNYKNLKGLDKKIYNKLAGLRGSRRSVFKKALANMRSQLGQKDFILDGLHYSPRYLPYMEEIFKSKGLPAELTRIPFVESSFNPHAESKVGASGLWQIMPNIGKKYFKVGDYIDERNSPLKATLVAADLMKFNYKYLKDWPLAVTAYNHGAYGVKQSLKKSKSTSLIQLISRHRGGAFKFASSNFYASFLAVLHAEKYHREIFKSEIKNQENLLRYSIYTLAKSKRANELIKMIGVDKETFLSYNLDLKDAVKKNARIPRNHRFLVPFERQLDLESKTHLGIKPVRTAVAEKSKSRSG